MEKGVVRELGGDMFGSAVLTPSPWTKMMLTIGRVVVSNVLGS